MHRLLEPVVLWIAVDSGRRKEKLTLLDPNQEI